MKSCLFILLATIIGQLLAAQNVGIGTTTPNENALLHVDLGLSVSKGILVSGIYNAVSIVPDAGAGSRMMFYPAKAAFRAGNVTGSQWDNANAGRNSVAMGYNTTASGDYATAIGYNTTAGGEYSTAMGYSTIASVYSSTAMGSGTMATGIYSTAMGTNTTASSDYATAMGRSTTASGGYSTAMGYATTASGLKSVAMGSEVWANGQGSFFFGDSDPNNKGTASSSTANQMAMRFNGGYFFITSDVAGYLGVRVPAGGNSWTTISDVRLKEKFLPVEGELFLQKISKLNLTSWNYKSQDSKTFRHYGPMAQDFYAAFGQDAFGSIGCDTLINQQDFLGVNLIAIQALVKRTNSVREENKTLKNEVTDLRARLEKLEKLLVKQ